MAVPRTATRADQRARLLGVALEMLEESGPEALQARALTAEIGASTQAVYTLFGGMPGLFEALVVDGFAHFGEHVAGVPQTDDPVADFFAKGWAYCDWALSHPQLYRLMFGLTGGRLRLHPGLEMAMSGTVANFPEAQAAVEVMVSALDRVQEAGRIRPVEPVIAAAQFLSATHGYVLLQIAGTFGQDDRGREVIGALGVNLMVGLGDSRKAAERSLQAVLAQRAEPAGEEDERVFVR
jgi:AcrR family transcriptional regulator